MYSLRKFAGRTGNIGQPLPEIYDTMTRAKIKFRHGGTSLIAGAPGSFKSVLALNMLAKWAPQDVSGLYFSMDSDEFTVAKRLGGILSGDSSEQFEKNVQEGNAYKYVEPLSVLNNCQFVYHNVDMESITNYVKAFEAIHGEFPGVIFVDNLINTVDDPTDWGGMIRMILDLDSLARETKSHICVLHHASESWAEKNPGLPPPSAYIQGKVNQIPRMVLTVAATPMLELNVAVVKNTNGPMDASAKNYRTFFVDESMKVNESAR
jgi:hypothetical protein